MRRGLVFLAALLGAAPCLRAQQGDIVRPGGNLVVEGIPPLPAALAARLRPYQNVRRAAYQDWCPGDGGMLITTRFGQTSQVHRVERAGGQRTQLTFFDERVAWARCCPRPGCDAFLFGMDEGGTEAYQIYRFDPRTGGKVLLTDGTSRNLPAVWNRAGDRVAYASTRRNGKDFDLWLMDPDEPSGRRLLLETSGLWTPLDFSPDDATLLVEHYVSINRSHLHLVEVATGKRTRLTPEDETDVSYRQARFSPDGKRIYFTSDRGWEFVRLGVVEPGAGEFEPRWLTPTIEWDVEDFDLSADGRLIAVAVNEGGFSRLHLLDARSGKRRPAPEVPAGVITDLAFQRKGRKLALTVTGSRIPGDVFVFDPRTKRLERWTTSETGGLDPASFAEPALVSYPTFDREGGKVRTIPALVYLPPKRFEPPWPVEISIHGGPEGQARPVWLGQADYRVNRMGIALIRPNVRGSAGYGKSYLLLDNAKRREDAVRDIGALLDWIGTRDDLDPKRVAVSGGSYGGYMSLATMTTYPERVRCGIDYVGISNFVTFLENTKPYRRDLRRAEYGDERRSGMRIYLDMISPLSNAHKITAPLFVIQGANDPRVPASESEQMVTKVRKAGGRVWYLVARDEGHGFVKKSNRDYLNLAIVQFLQEFLLQ